MLLAMVSVHELADLSKSHSYGIGRGGYKKSLRSHAYSANQHDT